MAYYYTEIILLLRLLFDLRIGWSPIKTTTLTASFPCNGLFDCRIGWWPITLKASYPWDGLFEPRMGWYLNYVGYTTVNRTLCLVSKMHVTEHGEVQHLISLLGSFYYVYLSVFFSWKEIGSCRSLFVVKNKE